MPEPSDRASRVHRLAIPTSVTFIAQRAADTFGDGEHYDVTGYTRAGESAFMAQTVAADGDTDTASTAIEVVLGRFRERGW